MTTKETEWMIGRIVKTGEIDSALPLEHTEVSAQMSGPVASVTVIQRFGNPFTEAAELEYLFPLPGGAALTDFVLRLGKRTILGELEEIERVREAYVEAREQGKRAGLVEQRRPNLFAVQIANLLPGETILAEMRYQERVKFSQDGYEFVYPMGITPKYDRPGHPVEGAGVHAPLAKAGEAVGTVELTLSIDAGLPCGEPLSPSHPLDVRRLDERRWMVRLAGEQIPDRDFVLRLPVAGLAPAAAGWCSPAKDGAYFLATILPPNAASDSVPTPREFIFVLDRSGSMGGEPILQARNALRACLRTLNAGDTFRILLFDDQLEWYQLEPCRVEQAEVDRADVFLSAVDARGGTEIIGALEAALALPADPSRTRFVVFLTDGAVSAETSALEMLRRKMGTARVFTFGIGPSVNRALLGRMARQGRGACEFLQADEDIEGAVIRFQDRVSFPALTDLQITWEGAKAWDVYPARLPDLYIGQPLEVSGRFLAASRDARLVVRGTRSGEAFETQLSLTVPAQADPAVARVWARARVDQLVEEMELDAGKADSLRSAVIALALEHRLATAYTAFVALDEQPAVTGGKAVRVRVAQPLPEGLDFGRSPVPPAMMPFQMAAPTPGSGLKQIAGRPRMYPHPKRRLLSMEAADFGEIGSPNALREDLSIRPETAGGTAAVEIESNFTATREEMLRELARTQRLDGSWQGSVEPTAAALLAFVRSGHTTTAGSFRKAVRRAASWLGSHPESGFAGRVRALALRELAERTNDAQLRAAAQTAEAGFGTPGTELEKAAANGIAPAGVRRAADLDTLRLAGFLGLRVEVAANLVSDPLARVWAALVM